MEPEISPEGQTTTQEGQEGGTPVLADLDAYQRQRTLLKGGESNGDSRERTRAHTRTHTHCVTW